MTSAPSNRKQATAWESALAGKTFGAPVGKASAPPAKSATLPSVPEAADPNAILLGVCESGRAQSLDLSRLIDGKLLIQGVSGAGKSWTLRRLLEQSADRIQQIVIDPEGEFKSLADELDHLYVAGEELDSRALASLAWRVREHRLSIVLDLSQCERDDQQIAVAAFLSSLIECPRDLWTPVLVALDEAHLFAPLGIVVGSGETRKAAISATTDLMSRGRKRGLVGVLATVRIARMAKSVVSEVHNFLIGLNTLDIDVKRAAETIGWSMTKAADRLPLLDPGHFIAVGPGFAWTPDVVRVGKVRSRHIGATPRIQAPKPLAPGAARELLGIDELVRSTEEAKDKEAKLSPRYRAVRDFIKDSAFGDAGRIYVALLGLVPDGATIVNLAAHCGMSQDAATAAIGLLDRYAAVELMETEEGVAVRIARGMTQ